MEVAAIMRVGRLVLIMFLMMGCIPATLSAQDCKIEASVPPKHGRVGSGSATVGSDGDITVKGGQAVFVAVKNNNVLGVSYNVTIEEAGHPPSASCSYHAILLPHTTVVLSNSLFAETPIRWKVSVSVGDESDAGVLTFIVYSNP